MIFVQAQAVARHFGADVLFSNVNLDIQDNSRIGLVGKNGAGKSTLISMLLGDSEPDEGQIVRKKGLTIGYLAQTTGLDSDRTVFGKPIKAPFKITLKAPRCNRDNIKSLHLEVICHNSITSTVPKILSWQHFW